jgi:two-component system, OmpR family, response regulator
MMRRSFYTTFEISQICEVNPTTVQNWIKGNKLRAFQTPGGHRRVNRKDLLAFLKEFGMPIPASLSADPHLIMLVDDEIDILDMLESVMTSGDEDVEVIKAQNGVEALLKIGEKKPSLLILDLKMPGMNGHEVCQKLKSNLSTQNIKIVAITGDHDPAIKKRILRAGADLFFAKPIDVVEFRKQCFEMIQ